MGDQLMNSKLLKLQRPVQNTRLFFITRVQHRTLLLGLWQEEENNRGKKQCHNGHFCQCDQPASISCIVEMILFNSFMSLQKDQSLFLYAFMICLKETGNRITSEVGSKSTLMTLRVLVFGHSYCQTFPIWEGKITLVTKSNLFITLLFT